MKTVTIVAKGPSAVHANTWCNRRSRIASINDSYKLFHRKPDFSFFSDVGAIKRWMEPSRINRLVHPELTVLENPTGDDVIPDWYHQWKKEGKVKIYTDRYCGGGVEDFNAKIAGGGICHHSTVAGAMHYLVKFYKYDKVRIIGVDGGTQYAPNMEGLTTVENDLIESYGSLDFLDLWKKVYKNLASVLTRHYGTEFEWYGE